MSGHSMSPIEKKVFDFIKSEHMLDGCGSVAVGLSGGADSVALLHILSIYCSRCGIKVYAFHVHHGIRGETADRDLKFCEKLCGDRKIEFGFVRLDVPSAAAKCGRGIEEVARDMRYDALEKFRAEKNIDRIAVAHHADDNLETLIFNLVRGSSSRGGCAIPPIRGKIIRPLLSVTKNEILDYIKSCGLEYVTDETNYDESYTRNFIRAQIVPNLKRINPSVCDAAGRFTESLRIDCDYLDKLAMPYIGENSCALLSSLDDAILYRVINKKFSAVSHGARLSKCHLDAIRSLIKNSAAGSSLNLPSGITVRIYDGNIRFASDSRSGNGENCGFSPYIQELSLGENNIKQADGFIYLWNKVGPEEEKIIGEKQNIYKLAIHKSFAFDRIPSGGLKVRSRLEGDRIRFGNMTRKVKKLFCDGKIPCELRSVYPIITDGEGILWIPGFPARDGTAANDNAYGDSFTIYCFFFRKSEHDSAITDNTPIKRRKL